MKTFLAVCLVVTSASAFAADDWTHANTREQLTFTGLMLVDRYQTVSIGRHPDLHEINPVLGLHPSNGKINNYFLATAIGHAAVAYTLPAGPWRNAWQLGGITVEAVTIYKNEQLKLSSGTPGKVVGVGIMLNYTINFK